MENLCICGQRSAVERCLCGSDPLDHVKSFVPCCPFWAGWAGLLVGTKGPSTGAFLGRAPFVHKRASAHVRSFIAAREAACLSLPSGCAAWLPSMESGWPYTAAWDSVEECGMRSDGEHWESWRCVWHQPACILKSWFHSIRKHTSHIHCITASRGVPCQSGPTKHLCRYYRPQIL